jgi:hypothetical protein
MHKKAATLALFPVLILMGFMAGRVIGKGLISNLILKDRMFPLLLSRPIDQFYGMHILLNSANPYSRLSGYYSLIDNKMINNEFLIDRYKNEDDFVIKRTILWILSYSEDSRGVLKFFSSIYDKSDIITKDMLAYMRHIDKGYYAKFIEVHKIDKKLLPFEER